MNNKQIYIIKLINSLTDTKIKQLAVSSGIYDCITDPWDSLKNGDQYSSVMPDLEKFARLIIEECTSITLDYKNDQHYQGWLDYRDEIKKHFEIE